MKLSTKGHTKIWMYKTSKKKSNFVITSNKKRNLNYRYLQTINEPNTGFSINKKYAGNSTFVDDSFIYFKNYAL